MFACVSVVVVVVGVVKAVVVNSSNEGLYGLLLGTFLTKVG